MTRELVVHLHKSNDPDRHSYLRYVCGRRARSDDDEIRRESEAGTNWRYCEKCSAPRKAA